MTHRRRLGPAVLLTALFGLLVTLAAAPDAHAQGYRYWSFWLRDGGTWTYATQGPAGHRPEDGDVIGFRFAVSRDSADDAARPRGDTSFEAACGGTPAKAGTERIGLVLDFGTAADAPGKEDPPARRTACARVSGDATAADALAAVAKPLRYNSAALLCAIDGYPARGCGERVSGDARSAGSARTAADDGAASDAAAGAKDDASAPWGFVVGAVLVALLAAGTVLQTRRRRG